MVLDFWELFQYLAHGLFAILVVLLVTKVFVNEVYELTVGFRVKDVLFLAVDHESAQKIAVLMIFERKM